MQAARFLEAARKGSLPEVESLVTTCNIEAVDCDVSHAYERWCFSGHFGCLCSNRLDATVVLLVHSAKFRGAGGESTAQSIASFRGRQHMFLLCCICQRGSLHIITDSDVQGQTALMQACSAGHVDVVQTLIKAGANLVAEDSKVKQHVQLENSYKSWQLTSCVLPCIVDWQ